MLKLYFARHTLIFDTFWDLLRGRPFDFWAGGGEGYGLFFYIHIPQTDFEEKNSSKEILGDKNSTKICFMA